MTIEYIPFLGMLVIEDDEVMDVRDRAYKSFLMENREDTTWKTIWDTAWDCARQESQKLVSTSLKED
jgi:hypothetical protein